MAVAVEQVSVVLPGCQVPARNCVKREVVQAKAEEEEEHHSHSIVEHAMGPCSAQLRKPPHWTAYD